jgi:tRNA modification GTPase
MPHQSTIAAISTPPGRSALAVVRVSGSGSFAIATELGLPPAEPRVTQYATVLHPVTGLPVDEVVAVRFKAPASYTGEDMLELSCHGGALAPQLVLEAVCAAGSRPAEPGEFTRRAFLNGKMDLMQVEATLDLIEARSPAMHRAALFQLERGLSRRIEELRQGLLELQGLLAYDIDFPEEDDGPVPADRIDGTAIRLSGQLARMLDLVPEGELLRDGALTVIAGRPNAGKSSLFNALLGFERAIVTEEPGTTRDAIEAHVSVAGYPFRVVDTAGLGEDPGRVEKMGIEVARSYLERADIVLLCVEAGREPGADEMEFLAEYGRTDGSGIVVLRTKADLHPNSGQAKALGLETEVCISAHTGEGIPELREALLQKAFSGIRGEEEVPIVTRERQVRSLTKAWEDVEAFRAARVKGLPSEVAGTHVQDATLALEDLLGTVTTDDVLDVVFGSFCVGK